MVDKLSVLRDIFKNSYFPLFVSIIIIGLIVSYVLIIIPSTDIKDNEVVKIHFAENISDSHKEVIKRFNKKYQGRIEVVPITLPFEKFSTNERKELLARTLRSKSSRLDVFTVDQIWVTRFAKWAEELEQYFPEKTREGFVQYALNTCYSDGKLYAIPLYMDIGLLYFKANIIEKEFGKNTVKRIIEGLTWDEFIELNLKLKKKGYAPFLFPADGYEGLMCTFAEVLYGVANKNLSNSGFNIDAPEFEITAKFIYDLINTLKITPFEVVNFKETESYNYFFNKNAVFLRGWPGLDHSIYKQISRNNNNLQILRAPLPKFKNSDFGSVFGGWNLMISKYSRHKKEALIFIKYLLSEESQMILFNKGGHLPIIERIYFKDNHQLLKFYYQLFNKGIYRPHQVNYTKISDIISHYLNLALKKEITLETALQKTKETLEKNSLVIK